MYILLNDFSSKVNPFVPIRPNVLFMQSQIMVNLQPDIWFGAEVEGRFSLLDEYTWQKYGKPVIVLRLDSLYRFLAIA